MTADELEYVVFCYLKAHLEVLTRLGMLGSREDHTAEEAISLLSEYPFLLWMKPDEMSINEYAGMVMGFAAGMYARYRDNMQ